MSRITDIKKALKKDTVSTLSALLIEYDSLLNEVEQNISLKGKTLEQANKEQASFLVFYDEKLRELLIIEDFMKTWVDKIRGQLFETIVNRSGKDLSDRAINQIIDSKEEYLNAYELYLEIKELAEKFDAVVESFKQRGFSLRNITELRVNRIHMETL